MNKLESIKIVVKTDENPDISYLGEYSNKPDKDGHFIDRQERGDMGRNEYRYFNIGCGDPEYIEQDYKRLESFFAGQWYFLGIVAEAEVSYDIGQGSRRIERFTSGGLWGIESDSDHGYIDSVAWDELADLRSHLVHFNVDLTEFQEMAEEAVNAMKLKY